MISLSSSIAHSVASHSYLDFDACSHLADTRNSKHLALLSTNDRIVCIANTDKWTVWIRFTCRRRSCVWVFSRSHWRRLFSVYSIDLFHICRQINLFTAKRRLICLVHPKGLHNDRRGHSRRTLNFLRPMNCSAYFSGSKHTIRSGASPRFW